MRRRFLYIVYLTFLISLPGCSVSRNHTDKIKDLSFQVLSEEKIPQELKKKIAEKEEKPFQMTYSDKGKLYIARGYGEKETNGYSVEVTKCYETDNAIYIDTNLLGPSKEEKVIRTAANPYVVVELKAAGKNVVFE